MKKTLLIALSLLATQPLYAANINKWGETALMKAVYKNNLELVKLLVENSARTDIQDENGKTAFDLASEQQIHRRIKEFLSTYPH